MRSFQNESTHNECVRGKFYLFSWPPTCCISETIRSMSIKFGSRIYRRI